MQLESKKDDDKAGNSDKEELHELMFKIVLKDPKPAEVKISKKNVCIVTISFDEEADKAADENHKMLEYFLSQKEETWSG